MVQAPRTILPHGNLVPRHIRRTSNLIPNRIRLRALHSLAPQRVLQILADPLSPVRPNHHLLGDSGVHLPPGQPDKEPLQRRREGVHHRARARERDGYREQETQVEAGQGGHGGRQDLVAGTHRDHD